MICLKKLLVKNLIVLDLMVFGGMIIIVGDGGNIFD